MQCVQLSQCLGQLASWGSYGVCASACPWCCGDPPAAPPRAKSRAQAPYGRPSGRTDMVGGPAAPRFFFWRPRGRRHPN